MAGAALDRVPVALWRHFPGDDQRAADLALSLLKYQREYDWDFLRVMPANTFMTVDHGLPDAWLGDDSGVRATPRPIIKRSLDWTDLRPLDPTRGALGQQVECLRLIGKALQADGAPALATVYSPAAQALQLAGKRRFLRDLRTAPERLASGLNVLAESGLRFLAALRELPGLAGIFLVCDAASHDLLSEAEYREQIAPHDHKLLGATPRHWWLNIVQLRGAAPMLKLAAGYRAAAINWDARAGEPDLSRGAQMIPGAVCGGLSDWDDLHQGTPALLARAARDCLRLTDSRHFILAGGGDGYITTPLSNLRALRSIVDNPQI